MNQYNIFQALYLSFFSKDFYRDVARNWGGKTFLYLLFLVALSWLAATINIQRNLNYGYKYQSDAYIAQIPVMEVVNGKLKTPENRPYSIKDPDNGQLIAIIDTTGKYTTLDQSHTAILVTQTSVISKRDNETKIYDLPANLNTTINPPVINNYIKDFVGFAWIPFFIIFVLCAYVYRIVFHETPQFRR